MTGSAVQCSTMIVTVTARWGEDADGYPLLDEAVEEVVMGSATGARSASVLPEVVTYTHVTAAEEREIYNITQYYVMMTLNEVMSILQYSKGVMFWLL